MKQTCIQRKNESGISFNTDSNYIFGSDANVGINTDNPSSRLQVKEGDIYIEDIDFGITPIHLLVQQHK
ncbi:MAG: hypothetical protein GXO88_03620 [Chlorobi bacterium]|nr:hypothetical protein [Chlorobiota bacterium]